MIYVYRFIMCLIVITTLLLTKNNCWKIFLKELLTFACHRGDFLKWFSYVQIYERLVIFQIRCIYTDNDQIKRIDFIYLTCSFWFELWILEREWNFLPLHLANHMFTLLIYMRIVKLHWCTLKAEGSCTLKYIFKFSVCKHYNILSFSYNNNISTLRITN